MGIAQEQPSCPAHPQRGVAVSGSGKTYLSNALGVAACRNGFTVRYVRIPDLLNGLAVARGEGTYLKMIRSYQKADLQPGGRTGIEKLCDRQAEMAVCKEHPWCTGQRDRIQHYRNSHAERPEAILLSHLCDGEDGSPVAISEVKVRMITYLPLFLHADS